jgi:hypothetical protein
MLAAFRITPRKRADDVRRLVEIRRFGLLLFRHGQLDELAERDRYSHLAPPHEYSSSLFYEWRVDVQA